MHKLFKSLVFFCALALIAVACGGDDEVPEAVAEASPATTASTTTAAPTSTIETTTTTEVVGGPVQPLTGEPAPDGANDHSAVVVKVSNNDSIARQAFLGLDQADIVFEERIEVGATRFAAVFHSSLPTEVGSVRSGRTSDVQIVANLGRPVFAISGANDGVNNQLRTAENDGLLVRASNEFADPQFERISEFTAPNNLVVDTAALLDKIEGGEAPQAIFDYSNNLTDIGQRSGGVLVAARDDTAFVWDEDLNGYLRFDDGVQSFNRDGAEIAPQNVVILTTAYVPSRIDSQSVDALTVGEGPVTVYSNGRMVQGQWTRGFERDAYTLLTTDGQIIGLAPGQTWVSLALAGTNSNLNRAVADEIRAAG